MSGEVKHQLKFSYLKYNFAYLMVEVKNISMDNYSKFTQALSEKFQIPSDIFNNIDISMQKYKHDGESFLVSEAKPLPNNTFADFFQYIQRFDEGWKCTRLYLNRKHVEEILQFILEYHSNSFSKEDLQPLSDIVENHEGHFAIPDETQSYSYLEGVFDEEQAFIEVAKPV